MTNDSIFQGLSSIGRIVIGNSDIGSVYIGSKFLFPKYKQFISELSSPSRDIIDIVSTYSPSSVKLINVETRGDDNIINNTNFSITDWNYLDSKIIVTGTTLNDIHGFTKRLVDKNVGLSIDSNFEYQYTTTYEYTKVNPLPIELGGQQFVGSWSKGKKETPFRMWLRMVDTLGNVIPWNGQPAVSIYAISSGRYGGSINITLPQVNKLGYLEAFLTAPGANSATATLSGNFSWSNSEFIISDLC